MVVVSAIKLSYTWCLWAGMLMYLITGSLTLHSLWYMCVGGRVREDGERVGRASDDTCRT